MTGSPEDRRVPSRFSRVSILLSVVIVIVPGAVFLVSAPRFGGSDSYFFLLYANDLAQSAAQTSFARYFYFPGSYAFWRIVAMAAGRDFLAYQIVFAVVALANAGLTAAIARASGIGAPLAALGFLGYLMFGQRLEIAEMTGEPFATLVALLGVWLWLVCRRRGRSRLGLALLGAGYGLAVFCKQQGAFIAMGAAGLLPCLWDEARSWSRLFRDTATIVASALTVFVLGMALDGGGVAAVKLGVTTAAAYQGHGGFVRNLIELASNAKVVSALLVGAVALGPIATATRKRRPSARAASDPAVWALGVATSATTLLPFAKRSYQHYALLTLPFALMAILAALAWALETIGGGLERAGRTASAARGVQETGIAAVLAIASLIGIEAWAWPRPLGVRVLPHEANRRLCDGIRPGERLLLLPSRENALHWACGTNARGTRWGYTFNFQERPEEYIEELAKPELSQVFVFKPDTGHGYEQEVFRSHDWSGFFAALERGGFRPVVERDAGILYRRESRVGEPTVHASLERR